MGKKVDLTGRRFGRLVVIEETQERDGSGSVIWKCLCECGDETMVSTRNLNSNHTNSCGCMQKDHAQRVGKRAIHIARKSDKFKRSVEKDSQEQNTKLSTIDYENRKIQKNNTSGVRGVSWDKSKKRWVAHLSLKGDVKLFKRFKDKQDAINAREEAEEKYFEPILEKHGI